MSKTIKIGGNVLRFRVVLTSAGDHNEPSGDRDILYQGSDLARAIEIAKRPVNFSYTSIEIANWKRCK